MPTAGRVLASGMLEARVSVRAVRVRGAVPVP